MTTWFPGRRVAGGSKTERVGHGTSDGYSDSGVIGQALVGAARLYPVPPASVAALLVAGVVLGAVGDALLRAPGPPGLNLSLWVASVAVAALALHRRAALALDRERVAWLVIGVVFAAGLAWRDAPPLKLLALGCATLTFALAAHRLAAAWVRRAGVLRYAGALALGRTARVDGRGACAGGCDAVHAACRDRPCGRVAPCRGRRARPRDRHAARRGVRRAVHVGRRRVRGPGGERGSFRLRADRESHAAVLDPGVALDRYLRGFLTGTELPPLRVRWQGSTPRRCRRRTPGARDHGSRDGAGGDRPAVPGLRDRAVPVSVRRRRARPGHARPDVCRVRAARLLRAGLRGRPRRAGPARGRLAPRPPQPTRRPRVPRPRRRADRAGARDHRVGAPAAAPLPRELRAHRVAVLRDGAADLDRRDAVWLAATVLRGRRDSFAFGTLASGLATVALLFVINPDAIIARTNVARMASADAPVRFDVAYATSLSADAVPVLIDALPALPRRRAVSARAAHAAALAAGPRSLDPQLELVGGAGE